MLSVVFELKAENRFPVSFAEPFSSLVPGKNSQNYCLIGVRTPRSNRQMECWECEETENSWRGRGANPQQTAHLLRYKNSILSQTNSSEFLHNMLLFALVPLESVEPPPMSEPSMLAAGQQFVTCCPPSTSFGTRLLDFNPLLLNFAQPVLPPPPPYTPRNSHPTHSDLLRMHNTPMIVEPENEVDVVGDEKDEKDETFEDEKNEEPLDLTVKRSPLCSPVPRASVITATGRSIVRSASSASTVNDNVQEHFKRSLSGKWPRRAKTEDEKSRASPMRRHTSFNSHVSVPLISRVKQSNNYSDIDEHFRRALGGNFNQLMKKKEEESDSVHRENLI